jgi:hypothetical protein
MFPPEILLIGAQKSGTSTLAYHLGQHPRIEISNPKEVHYYSRNWNKSVDWYKSKFNNPNNKICIDASTTYSMADPNSENPELIPQRVYSIAPNTKFIYIMRNPIERSYSGYWHNVRTGREKKSFMELAKNNESDFLNISYYKYQIEMWLKYFPIENFKFVFFEDLKENPQNVVEECFEFCNVEPINIEGHVIKNKTASVNTFGKQLNKLSRNYPFLLNVKKILPNKIVNTIRKSKITDKKIPNISNEEKGFLKSCFKEKNEELEALINKPLHKWKN